MTTASTTGDDQWTVRRILDWTMGYLKEQGSEAPRLEAEVLLAHARNCKRIQLYTQFDQPLTPHERSVMRELVKRRGAAEPVAYLVGHKEFFSLDFHTPPGVLVPRPETEVLVGAALDAIKQWPQPQVLDLCTGTGCVAIAIAKNSPQAQLTAVELHDVPFATARKNLERHELEKRVQLLQGSLWEPLPVDAKFHVIVSNPPYVATGELADLPRDIRDHEPRAALDGGQDGLDVIRQIIDDSPLRLLPSGRLMIELSPEQSETVKSLMSERGFKEVRAHNDLAGRPRVVAGQWTT